MLKNINKKIIILLILCVIILVMVVYELGLQALNSKVPLAVSGSCDILKVEKRIDETGRSVEVELSETQKSELENYLLDCTKKMTFENLRRFSGQDYDVLIQFVDFDPDSGVAPDVHHILVGRKNAVVSVTGERVYSINDADSVEEDVKKILWIE